MGDSWGTHPTSPGLLIAYYIYTGSIEVPTESFSFLDGVFAFIGVILCTAFVIPLWLIFIVNVGKKDVEDTKRVHLALNAFSVICYHLPKGMWFLGKKVVAGAPTFLFLIGRFF